MQIAILLYDNMTALDAIGPYEVLSRLPGAKVQFVAETKGLVRTDTRALGLMADVAISEVTSPDIVVVPGGPGDAAVRQREPVLAWLRAVSKTAQWTTSVCSGSLILGAAGLLRGRRATSHFTVLDDLRAYGAEPTLERVVFEPPIVTAAGVSSGIDMGLRLIQRIAGDEYAQAVQLGIEYDPQPPFDAGSPAKAPAHIVELVRGIMTAEQAKLSA
jgi:putative intracellular protease/amidase